MSANVSDEVVKRLMHAAVDSNCSLSELVERAIRRGLDEGWLPGERCTYKRRGRARSPSVTG
ncbi:MAG: hypothetical protein RXR82_07910 [Nitrososphaeria archaeon]